MLARSILFPPSSFFPRSTPRAALDAQPMKTLLILGATGLVGQQLLQQALASSAVSQVVAPTRRPLPAQPRLFNPIVDYRQLPEAAWWQADALLCALGTTRKLAGSAQAFAEVDHDHVLAAARKARAAGTPCLVLNSSLGADARARGLYLRVKGQTEDDVAALGFASLSLVRPALLDGGPRPDKRPAEAMGLVLLKAAGRAVPARYRPVRTSAVARVMLAQALQAPPGRVVIESEQIEG